jgi:hypothetical protein
MRPVLFTVLFTKARELRIPENTTGVEEVLERAVDKALEQAELKASRHKHRVSNSANKAYVCAPPPCWAATMDFGKRVENGTKKNVAAHPGAASWTEALDFEKKGRK